MVRIKEHLERLYNSVCKVIPIFFITFLLYGIMIFATGFHNIDICHNDKVMECMVNTDLREYYYYTNYTLSVAELNTDGGIDSLSDCYVRGLKQIVEGLEFSILGAFLFGVSYAELTNKRRIL